MTKFIKLMSLATGRPIYVNVDMVTAFEALMGLDDETGIEKETGSTIWQNDNSEIEVKEIPGYIVRLLCQQGVETV